MKKKYIAPPEVELLRFDDADICAASPEDGQPPTWGGGRFDFPMIPL